MFWQQLAQHHERLKTTAIAELFERDPGRASRFSLRFDNLLFDYSKTRIDGPAFRSLLALAADCRVTERRDSMFAGEKINNTEQRAALHTALRHPGHTRLAVDGADIMPEIRCTLERMERFAEDVRSGRQRSATGAKFTDVVNIGIGGSDLGPSMACDALFPYGDGPAPHFISNVDGAQAAETLAALNPRSTLVIVASKTFTTAETMTNARTVRQWMQAGAGENSPECQFAAVSSSVADCVRFGVRRDRVFGFADWVGGRYSLWGPVGLALMVRIGGGCFRGFLAGGHSMDRHFAQAPPAVNLPIVHGLTGIWHNQVCGHQTRAVLPYDHRLRRLPAYLQQLVMESNGKSVTRAGKPLAHSSAAVVWGEPGTNGQHAFFQALHQGNQVIPCEFLLAAKGHEPNLSHQHDLLVANCLAQSESLMRGRGAPEFAGAGSPAQSRQDCSDPVAACRRFPGNRPSSTLIYPKLTPCVFGQIIALYEHSVFVEGAILDINSFDQWGVELGKELAERLLRCVTGEAGQAKGDGSTDLLLKFVREARATEP